MPILISCYILSAFFQALCLWDLKCKTAPLIGSNKMCHACDNHSCSLLGMGGQCAEQHLACIPPTNRLEDLNNCQATVDLFHCLSL